MINNFEKYSYFDLLEIEASPIIDLKTLEENYLNLQNKYHPDRYKDAKQKATANSVSQEINKAFSTLKDELNRRIYLLSLSGINVVNEKSEIKTSEDVLQDVFNLRSKMEEAIDLSELEEFKSFIINSYNEMIKKFDECHFAGKQIDSSYPLVSAIFYHKSLNEINLRMSEVYANT